MEFLWPGLCLATAGAVVVVLAHRIAAHRFRCKHCAGEFRIPWHRVLRTEHSGSNYKLVCPYCKTKDWCAMQLSK